MSATLPISTRAARIEPSATLAVSARATALRAAGKQVLNLSAGEPDFAPPAPVRETVARLVAEQAMRYAPVPGLPALREAVAEQLGAVHGQSWDAANVLVSCGAKHSLSVLMSVTLDPGDEVVIPAPYWVSYHPMVRLAEGRPVDVATRREDGWRLRPQDLERALGPRTRYVLLNSPANPTGVGYTADDLHALGEVMARCAPQAYLLCDDIYRTLVYDGYQAPSAFRALEGVTEQIVIVDGVSKSHAMTGYRIGFLVAPAEVIRAASAVQGQTTSGAATPSQHAALVALTDPACAPDLAHMRAAFARRRALMLEGLEQAPGVEVVPPDGAFYVLADLSAYCGPGKPFADDVALATWLLDEHLVAAVPGAAFGAPGCLRLSYATDDAAVAEAVSRIGTALRSRA